MKFIILGVGLFAAPAFASNAPTAPFADCQVTSTATAEQLFNNFNDAQQACQQLTQQLNINNNECSVVNAQGGKKKLRLRRARKSQAAQGAQAAVQQIVDDLLNNSVFGVNAFLQAIGGQQSQALNVQLTTNGDCSQL